MNWTQRIVNDSNERMGRWTKTLLGASALAFILVAGTATAYAHGGRTNSQGCHKDSKTGKTHCHGKKSTPSKYTPKATYLSDGTLYFPNCTAARKAGKSNIRRGQPGYGKHLDRDGDGIACE